MAQTPTQQVKGVARAVAVQGLVTASKAKMALDRRRATPSARRALDVVARCLQDDFAPEDRRWFDKAEAQRAAMLADTSAITMLDFGAGAPDQNLSDAEMSAGKVKNFTVAEFCRLTAKKPLWARILYALIAEYQPKVALELGTSVGVSATYQGGALQRYGGRLVTIEGAPEIARVARSTVEAVGLRDVVEVREGRFSDVLPSLLASTEPLDYVFVDGHHDEHATQEYHQMVKPHLAPGAVLVYDDIHWSPGMERAWAAISADPDLCVTVDLYSVGIAVLGTDAKHAYNYQLRGAV